VNVKKIEKQAKNTVKKRISKSSIPKAVVMFDLSGSTKLKMDIGHSKAKKIMDLHNEICKESCKSYKGKIVKELGDGVLVVFGKGMEALKASILARTLLKKNSIDSKIVITYGDVEQINIGKQLDIFGSTVDRCAKIEKFALKNQILIDNTLQEVIGDFVKDVPEIKISESFDIDIKGYGNYKLYEIGTSTIPLKHKINIELSLSEKGRLPLKQKVNFVKTAKKEVIEIGSGIRQFSQYFVNQNSSQFKEPIEELLKKGVNIKCFAVDYDWVLKNGKKMFDDIDYFKQIRKNLLSLDMTKKEITKNKKGKFEIYTYKEIPYFHAFAVDLNTNDGKLIISNYLPSLKKSECPVLEFSKKSNPDMFQQYKKAIGGIIKKSKKWKP
jgi:class 3 adenylate cyclase